MSSSKSEIDDSSQLSNIEKSLKNISVSSIPVNLDKIDYSDLEK